MTAEQERLSPRRSQPVAERLSVDEFGDQERITVHIIDFVDRQDRRMVQGRGGLCFLGEASQPFRVARERGRQTLDGDLAAELRVFSRVHLAHADPAEEADDPVVLQRRAGREVRVHSVGRL